MASLVWMYAQILLVKLSMVGDGHVTHTRGNTRPINVFTQLRLITLNKNVMKEGNYALFVGGEWT